VVLWPSAGRARVAQNERSRIQKAQQLLICRIGEFISVGDPTDQITGGLPSGDPPVRFRILHGSGLHHRDDGLSGAAIEHTGPVDLDQARRQAVVLGGLEGSG
jgi:hypothetical protein